MAEPVVCVMCASAGPSMSCTKVTGPLEKVRLLRVLLALISVVLWKN